MDAELLVKDLRRSVKRRPATGAATQSAAAGDGQQQGGNYTFLTHSLISYLHSVLAVPFANSLCCLLEGLLAAPVLVNSSQRCMSWMGAGPGVQLPWNWKLPQMLNPFAQPPPEAVTSSADSPAPAARAAQPLLIAPNSVQMDKPGVASSAAAPKQDAAASVKLPQKQDAAGQFQWPVWGKGPAEGRRGEDSVSAGGKPQQQQPGSFLGLHLPKLKNPFEGWGSRVAPSSG